jgi:molecular chaperone Hsp33
VQELPSQLSDKADWERIVMLANTVTGQEMLELDCEGLLHRLFHEESVRLFDGEPVAFSCSCSQKKIENTLRLLGRPELESILLERGLIEVNCEFCNKYYRFDKIDVEQLLRNELSPTGDTHVQH